MIKEAIGIAETIELAKESACRKLEVEPNEVEFEILQVPIKGKLGLFGKKNAKVKAIIKTSPLDMGIKYVRDILNSVNLESVEISVKKTDDGAMLDLVGEGAWNLVGKRGETLNALQYLTCLVANRDSKDSYFRINIDIENYREKREKILKNLSVTKAMDVLKTKKRYAFEPMNPYERKIIHMALDGIEGISSWSEGENFNRHIVIGLACKETAKT